MKKSPAEVAPIVHNGIRYLAPHWRRELPLEPGQDAAEALEENRMQATMVNAMARGGPADLSPRWVKETLLQGGHEPAHVERLIDKMVVHRTLQDALLKLATSVTRQGSSLPDESPLGYATKERLTPLLTESGLTAEQVQTALNFLEKQKNTSQPQEGGYLLAIDHGTGNPIWCMKVYETVYSAESDKDEQDVFIRELSLDGDELLVRDDAGRLHRVDLTAKTVRS